MLIQIFLKFFTLNVCLLTLNTMSTGNKKFLHIINHSSYRINNNLCCSLKLILRDDVTEDTLLRLELSMYDVLHLLYVAKKYDVVHIPPACRDFIEKRKSIKNIILIYEALQSMNEEELELDTFNLMST